MFDPDPEVLMRLHRLAEIAFFVTWSVVGATLLYLMGTLSHDVRDYLRQHPGPREVPMHYARPEPALTAED